MITIVDYGVGNLSSVQNMLRKCGVNSQLSKNPDEIRKSRKIILPGVGAFDSAMQKLNEQGLRESLGECSKKGTLILGICLGAQLLLEKSEEGILSGLALIKGKCIRFNAEALAPLRVPHMGWNEVTFVRPEHPLADFDNEELRFYFTHSYYLAVDSPQAKLATCIYGHEFTCGVVHENIMGVQFHPEKSHRFGARLLTNFAKM